MNGDQRAQGPVTGANGSAESAPSAKRIALATLAALGVAGVLLVTVILPAEYGIDPLGTGRLLGVSALADVRPGVVTPQQGEHRRDLREFVLRPFQSVEYKYRIEEGGGMLYSWKATGLVSSELHSEPDGAPEGYAETFDKQQGVEAHGTFVAPFPGIHGWYWENLDKKEVTITLATAGFYDVPQEFFGGGVTVHELTDVRGQPIQKAGK
jgi:hypothetical protein